MNCLWVAEQGRKHGLNTAQFAVLSYLACVALEGRAAVSRDEIGATVGLKPRHIQTVIASLVDKGLIAIERFGGGKKGRPVNTYIIAPSTPVLEAPQCYEQPSTGTGVPVNGIYEQPTAGCEKENSPDPYKKTIPPPSEHPSGCSSEEGGADAPAHIPLHAGDGSQAIALFAEAAARAGWITPRGAPSQARKTAVRARLREHGGLDAWRAQIAQAEAMPFLAGVNDRGWRMDLDFFASPRGWAAIAEGKYVRSEHGIGTHQARSKPQSAVGALVAEARRLGANI